MAHTEKTELIAWEIRVQGRVQGVGFRPTVWRLARDSNLAGDVLNDGQGVLVHIWASEADCIAFCRRLEDEKPPLSRIGSISYHLCTHPVARDDFVILPSGTGRVLTEIAVDTRSCEACLCDVADPQNRRFRHPFANCTHCGPRLSITRALPYDRANTSMSDFRMCPACLAEYEDPSDRRFHAQPIACPDCGPAVWLCDQTGTRLEPEDGRDVMALAADLLRGGAILAIKGIGGFQLTCDALNAEVVKTLRERKGRYGKPLALMAANIAMIDTYAEMSPDQASLLQSGAAPIVLLQKKEGAQQLATEIAPDFARLGFMLPTSPLHQILTDDVGTPLVMTSANKSHMPQVTDNRAAMSNLARIADYWLMHDRDIINRVDDSVVQFVTGKASILRRARGYAPEPFSLPEGFETTPDILAMGADLKNTFCLCRDGQAIVSQHIGDLANLETHTDYRRAIDLYQAALETTPNLVATDMFPGYHSTQAGVQRAAITRHPAKRFQHHHAHIAACLAEHRFPIDCPPVLGVVLDGLGYAPDGDLWGGEFLIADYHSCERRLSLEPVALPGGDAAAREPWRNTFAHLDAALGWQRVEKEYEDLELVAELKSRPLDVITQMIARNLNAPPTSSAGRLFDAVAGALGICTSHIHFEGQAAMELEALAARSSGENGTYPFETGPSLSFHPMWRYILEDLASDVGKHIIAARFHNTVTEGVAVATAHIAAECGIKSVILSGGVFQNKILAESVISKLSKRNFDVRFPRLYPASDGGISLGQAILAAAQSVRKGAQ